MNRVTLQFPDLYNLWQFALTLKDNGIQINTNSKTLTCMCKEDDIHKAITLFKAHKIESHVTN